MNATTTGFRWPSRGNSFSYSLGGGADVGGNPGFLSISLSHVATLHFCFGYVCVFFRFSSHSSALEHFSGCVFPNNQHFFCVLHNSLELFHRFFDTFLPCFCVELVLYICI